MKETHVTADDLLALRAGTLRPDRIADVLDHVAGCPECRVAASKVIPIDYAGETLLASVLHEEPPAHELLEAVAGKSDAAPSSKRVKVFLPAAIAASLLVAFAAAFWMGARDSRVVSARSSTPRTDVAVSTPSPAAEWRREVDGIAARGVITPPAVWKSLQIGEVTFRGSEEGGGRPALLRPYREIVGETRVRFRWSAPPGTISIVSIYDGGERVTSSGELTSREWTADRDLQPGHSYLWQVEIRERAQRIVLPPPSEPVARFVIADHKTRERLDAVRRADPNDHLALGILAGLAGMQEDARHEFEAVAPDSPQYPAARALLASVKGWKSKE